MDTIFAPATAPGRSGIAILRISGPDAQAAAAAMCGGPVPPGRPSLRRIETADGVHVDTALVLGFAEGASFTGEATVEFHVHGSRAVLATLMADLGRRPGLRLAEPGEFTRRALMNGRLDLTQVEGLADLIDAETEQQRRQALRVMSGETARRVDLWRSALVRAAALLEATIDFSDDDVPDDLSGEVLEMLEEALASLASEEAGFASAERIRDGFEVAIVGAPNVGKSTLLNALARREAALTSTVAGTTRDVIEVRMDLDGLPVTLLDTAGLRETEETVERLGVERARERATASDLRIHLLSSGETPLLQPLPGDIVVMGKADLGCAPGGVSGLTGAGVPELLTSIGVELGRRAGQAGLVVRERQQVAVCAAIGHTRDAIALLNQDQPSEIVAHEVYAAIRALDVLIGRVDVEHVLDEIFLRFCLGK